MIMKLFLKMQSSNLVDVRRAETFLNSYDKAVAEWVQVEQVKARGAEAHFGLLLCQSPKSSMNAEQFPPFDWSFWIWERLEYAFQYFKLLLLVVVFTIFIAATILDGRKSGVKEEGPNVPIVVSGK